MSYGILYSEDGKVHVSWGGQNQGSFNGHLGFLRKGRAAIHYSSFTLNSQAEEVFIKLSARSEQIPESELPAIMAQLSKSGKRK